MYFKTILILFTIILFSGCSKVNANINVEPQIQSASLQKTLFTVKSKLNNFYKEYEGVRYKFGGNSKSGIDCSAFVQKAYLKSFNIKMPRTTKRQVFIGRDIKKSELQLADIVFFKTGYDSRHVGIYLNNGRFMHASSSKGVTISKLNNSYFKKHYWKAKRVIF